MTATHCTKGHRLTPENTMPLKNGSNRCRKCKVQLDKTYREENRAKVNEWARKRYALKKKA